MQIDSGSPVTVMGTNLFNSKLNLSLCRMSNQLTVINDSTQNKSGEIEVAVELDGGQKNSNLLVPFCDDQFIPLLDKTWLDDFFSNWRNVFGNSMPFNNYYKILEKQNEALIAVDQIKIVDVFVNYLSKAVCNADSEGDDFTITKKDCDIPYSWRENIFKLSVFDSKIQYTLSLVMNFGNLFSRMASNMSAPTAYNEYWNSEIKNFPDKSLVNARVNKNNIMQEMIYSDWLGRTYEDRILANRQILRLFDVCSLFHDKVNIPQTIQEFFKPLHGIQVGVFEIKRSVKHSVHFVGINANFIVACDVYASVAINPKQHIIIKILKRKPATKLLAVNKFSKRVEVKWLMVNWLVIFAKCTKLIASFRMPGVMLLDNGLLCKRYKLSFQDLTNSCLFPYNLTLEDSFPSEKSYYHKCMLVCLINFKRHNLQHVRKKLSKAFFCKHVSNNSLQIMIESEATTTVHLTQLRLANDGRGMPRRSMRVVETGRPLLTDDDTSVAGRPLLTTAESTRASVHDDTFWQLPDLSARQTPTLSEVIQLLNRNMSRKRKFPSELVALSGLPWRSKRPRVEVSSNMLHNEYLFILNYCSFRRGKSYCIL
ncbi:uncharacterized protein LOC134219258 [Armigeres subalbatus]|uniref:uncharacterized protein LOC134219258 n=1 Tax=Armigeres subalbatus TaxID=124917 RepID=UPI002ED12446